MPTLRHTPLPACSHTYAINIEMSFIYAATLTPPLLAMPSLAEHYAHYAALYTTLRCADTMLPPLYAIIFA